MPSRSDDAAFGGKRGSSAKAYRAMLKRYGAKKGEQVYHATVNERTGRGGVRRAMGSRARRQRRASRR